MLYKILALFLISTIYLLSTENPDQIAKTQLQPIQIRTTLGFTFASGNSDTRILTFDSDVKRNFERFIYYTKLNFAYGTSKYGNGPRIETTNNWLISTRIDWFTTDKRKSYIFISNGLSGNKFRGYWSRISAQFGAGYNFFYNVDTLKLKLGLGIDYSKDNLVVKGNTDDEFFFTLFKPEFELVINKNIKLGNNANFFVDLQEFNNYRVNSQTYFNIYITNRLAISLNFTLNYDNKPRTIPEIGENGRPTGKLTLAKPSDKVFNIGISILV